MLHRHHLGFVENHHAVGDVVEFPAAGGAGRIEGFKKLYHGGNNHRLVPVFGGQGHGMFAGIFPILLTPSFFFIDNPAVVFQHIFASQNFPEFPGGLVNDGAVGDHIDHSLLSIRRGMAQGKGQGRDGFSPAGGDGQGKQPRRLASPLQALP